MRKTKGELEADAVTQWLERVRLAEDLFLSSFTYASLKRLDAELHENLFEQKREFEQACVTGTVDDIVEQGEATLRGFSYCAQALKEADRDGVPGVVHAGEFVIVQNPNDAARTPDTVVLTADDLAEILRLPSVQTLLDVLRAWPGSRLTETKT